ncbi:MAG: PDZ domain-containing protein, partial [Solirubrobacteraceae bacterium]|nr:PDZ domain-containing protein [Solirubrobacteraceae bacterium]
KVEYAYLGVESAPVYPQLAERFDLGTSSGAWVQRVTDGGPSDDAGLRAGNDRVRFQASPYRDGGDVVIRLGGRPVGSPDELGQALRRFSPGDKVPVVVIRDGKRVALTITAGERPVENP